eukprot:c14786_g1_i1.p1 GENE.c14786_g1_i1~~c14786_g1_i1.p1  ORF type:complete len:107 (+),score=18.80 c14786_g1_i1:804-1124(+)
MSANPPPLAKTTSGAPRSPEGRVDVRRSSSHAEPTDDASGNQKPRERQSIFSNQHTFASRCRILPSPLDVEKGSARAVIRRTSTKPPDPVEKEPQVRFRRTILSVV